MKCHCCCFITHIIFYYYFVLICCFLYTVHGLLDSRCRSLVRQGFMLVCLLWFVLFACHTQPQQLLSAWLTVSVSCISCCADTVTHSCHVRSCFLVIICVQIVCFLWHISRLIQHQQWQLLFSCWKASEPIGI